MWFIYDGCGIACAILTYAIVICVDIAMVVIALLPEISEGKIAPYFHLVLFHMIVLMIFVSHLKCMLSDPGCLPKNQGELNTSFISSEAKDLYEKSVIAYEEIQRKFSKS